jgi:hypothetical protein
LVGKIQRSGQKFEESSEQFSGLGTTTQVAEEEKAPRKECFTIEAD